MLDGMSDSIQGSRIENLQSREVDRQSPTGLIFIIWPGAAHALIWVKLNPQVYFVQQQILAKSHPDRLIFGRMADEQPAFELK